MFRTQCLEFSSTYVIHHGVVDTLWETENILATWRIKSEKYDWIK